MKIQVKIGGPGFLILIRGHILAVFLLLGLPAIVFGNDAGTTSGQSVLIGMNARAAALGEAYSTMGQDAETMHWNAAGTTQLKKRSVVFTHTPYIDASHLSQASYAQKLGNRTAVGLSFRHFSAGRITETTNASGTSIGTFNPQDQMALIGIAHKIGGYSVGLNARYINLKIKESASTFAFDAGLLSPTTFNERLRFALTARHVGGQIKFENEADDLPAEYRGGAALRITPWWMTSVDVALPSDNDVYVAAGTEMHHVWEDIRLAGRVGFNSRQADEIDGLSGVAFGLGVGILAVNIDYALVPFGDLGKTHRVTLGIDF